MCITCQKKKYSKPSNIALFVGNKHFAYIVKIKIQFFFLKNNYNVMNTLVSKIKEQELT